MKKILLFLKKGVWEKSLEAASFWSRCGTYILRIFLLTLQGFTSQQIPLAAASLTYYTLLAFVPAIALVLGVARGFFLESTLQKLIMEHFVGQESVGRYLFSFAHAALESTQKGIIAGIGILVLLWSMVKILSNIEIAFNQMWETDKGRDFGRKIVDYLALIILSPLFIFLASGVSLFVTSHLSTWNDSLSSDFIIGPAALLFIRLIPTFLAIILFSFIYVFIPNKHVNFMPALTAGIFTGVVYQLVQYFYVHLQVGVTEYNAVYGTFAAIPLFLIWLYISWMIMLLGAKISFALQNVEAHSFQHRAARLSQRHHMLLSLALTLECIKDFIHTKISTSFSLAKKLHLPEPLVSHLLLQLTHEGILSEVKKDYDNLSYQPALPLETLTIKSVIDMMINKGATPSLPHATEIQKINSILGEFEHLIETSKCNVLLKDIIQWEKPKR